MTDRRWHPGWPQAYHRQTLTGLLREAKEAHTVAETYLPDHDWQDWYGAYIAARTYGQEKHEAIQSADDTVRAGSEIPFPGA